MANRYIYSFSSFNANLP